MKHLGDITKIDGAKIPVVDIITRGKKTYPCLVECTLLQGYPANWLDICEWTDENGKTHKDADTPKYKAAGNSIALPFWAWLFRRINAQYERQATMGSLFDGIGGFPLTAIRNGIKPLWASEIEAFPIAVCKKHFGDEDAGIEGDIWKYL